MDLIKFVDNGMENSTFTTYRTKQFNIETFETKLVEVVDTLTNAVDTNCAMIPLWKQVCLDDEPTCQLAKIEFESAENAITILTQTMYSLSGACKLQDFPSSEVIIKRCHNGHRWTTSEGVNEKFTFLEKMLQGYYNHISRNKPFIVSGPIAIAIAIGLF